MGGASKGCVGTCDKSAILFLYSPRYLINMSNAVNPIPTIDKTVVKDSSGSHAFPFSGLVSLSSFLSPPVLFHVSFAPRPVGPP